MDTSFQDSERRAQLVARGSKQHSLIEPMRLESLQTWFVPICYFEWLTFFNFLLEDPCAQD